MPYEGERRETVYWGHIQSPEKDFTPEKTKGTTSNNKIICYKLTGYQDLTF